jgi:hypothetical protein
MKKIISKLSFAIIAIAAMFLLSFKVAENENARRVKHVNLTFTSTGGCSVHIEGDVTYSLIPFSVTGFHGNITLSGSCSGSYNFNKGVAVLPASALVSSGSDGHIKNITWTADEGLVKILALPEIDTPIKTSFENIAVDGN